MFEKKIFTQTLLNKAGNGFENSKGAYYRVFNNGYSKHFRDMTSGTKLKKMIKEHVWKKNFYSNAKLMYQWLPKFREFLKHLKLTY